MSDKDKVIVGEVKNRLGLLKPLLDLIKKPITFVKNKYKSLPKIAKIISLPVFLIIIAGGAYGAFKVVSNLFPNSDKELTTANNYLIQHDKSQALVHARAALAAAPDDPNAILAVATLVEKDNPIEAKQLYTQALEVLKQQDNPDVSGKKAATYWAAAGLAERAGLTDAAKKYYQKVIDAANLSNSYEKSLVKQSQAALKRLQ